MSTVQRRGRRRFTFWNVTVNTNHAANSAAEEQRIGDRLERFVRFELSKIENWRRIIRITPSFDAVERIRLDGIGIERGPRKHRMHVHMAVIVEHHGNIDHKHGQRQFQNLLKEKLPELRGAYVKMRLGNASSLNYTAKEHSTSKEIKQFGMRDAVVF